MPAIQTYSANSKKAEENFAYFEDVVDRLFFHLEVNPLENTFADKSVFEASLDVAPLGDLAFSKIKNEPVCVRRTRRSVSRIADRHYILKFQAQGHSLFSQFGRAAHLRPGDLVLCDNTEPYQLLIAGPSEQVAIVVPEHLLDSRIPDLRDSVGCRMSREVALNSVVGELIRSLSTRIAELSPAAQQQSQTSLLDLVSMALKESGDRVDQIESTDRLAAIMFFIQNHLRDPDLSPQRIASEHGISPRYLHMLFKAAGSSVGRFVREQRVERCRMKLDGEAPVTLTDIALEWGFSDLAHFSRSFKDRYGISPLTYRKKLSSCANDLS